MKRVIDRIEEIIVIFLLCVMTLILSLQVFCRFVLDLPLTWSEEAARYLFVWITFIGAGYGVKHHYHIEMEAVVRLFPKKSKVITQVITNSICIAAFSYIIPDSLKFVANQGQISSSAMGISMGLVFACIPIGVAILVVRLVIDTVHVVRGTEHRNGEVVIE